MCNGSELSRLCRLIRVSLSPFYNELGEASITEDFEKDALIALSRIVTKTQLSIQKLSSSSKPGKIVKYNGTLPDGDVEAHHEEHQYMYKMMSDLIVLLTVENQFVRHLVGNVLVLLSEFFAAASERKWGEFIRSLCVLLEWSISEISLDQPAASRTKAEVIDCNPSSCIVVLKPRLKNIDWIMVAGVVRVLRNILKHLKQVENEHLLKFYLLSVNIFISSPLLEVLKIRDDLGSHAQRSSLDALILRNSGQQESLFLFLGHLVQLFCSLVESHSLTEFAGVSQDNKLALSEINKLLPNLLHWCLGQPEERNKSCIFEYFRHKILMIMIRLSSNLDLECSAVSLWLGLVHGYFEDLLLQPLVQPENGLDNCLEGSPFLLNFCDEMTWMCSHHLQRQVVFLFLKCSVSLINMSQNTDEQCSYAARNMNMKNDVHSDPVYICEKKALMGLYQWVQVHFPTNMFLEDNKCMEGCIYFASSFLQLFLHEDDMLFNVLLQLHTLSSCTEKWSCRKTVGCKKVKDDWLLLLELFNPVCLFHLFLSKLCYDHLVLLDYLISKDTGISCAEYLLRTLRVVCDSWHSFIEFPTLQVGDQSPCKRPKVFPDSTPSLVKKSSVVTEEQHEIVVSLEENCVRDCKVSNNYLRAGQPFQDAKRCLLVLRESVVNLHQKKLFPYNPDVLLRRLTRFEELCLQEGHH